MSKPLYKGQFLLQQIILLKKRLAIRFGDKGIDVIQATTKDPSLTTVYDVEVFVKKNKPRKRITNFCRGFGDACAPLLDVMIEIEQKNPESSILQRDKTYNCHRCGHPYSEHYGCVYCTSPGCGCNLGEDGFNKIKLEHPPTGSSFHIALPSEEETRQKHGKPNAETILDPRD